MNSLPEHINQVIRQRRSIYPPQYSGEKVPKTIIEQMLENATWAPTHRLTEPWRFVVFEEKGLENLLAKMAQIYQDETPAENFKIEKYQKLGEMAVWVSHIIALGICRHESLVPEIEEVCSLACAVQNMSLTATAYGVGTYWSTGGGTFSPEMPRFLGFDKCLGFLYVGMPKGKQATGKRKHFSETTQWRTT